MRLPDNTIWHLIQSSCAFKLSNRLFIFDYPLPASRTGKNDGLCTGYINPSEIRHEQVLVFISHGHEDHFHPDIFLWKKDIRQISYMISSDIGDCPSDVLSAHPGNTYDIDDIRVKTYKSTDLGVAYSIYAGGKHVYFSGDNGFWNWDGSLEDDVYINQALTQIDISQPIDVAFQLCDPRLADMGAGGVYIVARVLNPSLLVPIHSFGNYAFNKQAETTLSHLGFQKKFWCISHRGESITISS